MFLKSYCQSDCQQWSLANFSAGPHTAAILFFPFHPLFSIYLSSLQSIYSSPVCAFLSLFATLGLLQKTLKSLLLDIELFSSFDLISWSFSLSLDLEVFIFPTTMDDCGVLLTSQSSVNLIRVLAMASSYQSFFQWKKTCISQAKIDAVTNSLQSA